jgi:hypothetical protein
LIFQVQLAQHSSFNQKHLKVKLLVTPFKMQFALVAFLLAGLAIAAPQFPGGAPSAPGAGGFPKGKAPGAAGLPKGGAGGFPKGGAGGFPGGAGGKT